MKKKTAASKRAALPRAADYASSFLKDWQPSALVAAGKVRTTHSARVGAAALGFDYSGMTSVIMNLTQADFYKSMTAHADHKIWQDVYRPSTPAGDVYLKLTVIDDVLIVSFKEL